MTTEARSHVPGIRRLFVTVGTDYHRFDRLIWWLDEWMASEPNVGEVMVQRGTSAAPERAANAEYLQRAHLIDEFQKATTVVCHGGPATILECRSNGLVPIVVPREQRFDEHVNDHQVDFCERLSAHGEIQLARTKEEFFRLLDLAVERGAPAVATDDGHARVSLANFEDAMVELLGERARTTTGPLADVVPISPSVRRIPVLFVGSVPRSGSTIVADLLNEHPHMSNIGELVHLWERGVIENNLCGCGRTFAECEFWGKVGEIAFGGWRHVSGDRMRALQLRADRTRHIPALLAPGFTRGFKTSIGQYGAVVSRILRAVLEVSGAPVVVDTSKHVSTALLLRQLPDVDLRVLHLVRDPRGVAHSWSKSVARPEVIEADREMARLHPARIGLRWMWFNWAFSNMDRLGVPVTTMRYEDFVVDPHGALDHIFEFAGVAPTAQELFDTTTALELGEGHSVAGNPRRLEREPVAIRADDAWKAQFDPRMRALVRRVTAPLMSRYRYSGDD